MSSYMITVLVLASTMIIMLCSRASGGGPCKATRFPVLCAQALAISKSSSSKPDVVDTISALIYITLSRTNRPLVTSNYVDTLTTSRSVSPQARNVMRNCDELMRMSTKSLKESMKVLSKKSLDKVDKEDVQTWLSAAITYTEVCKDAVGPHVATNAYMAKIHKEMDHLSALGSNPLALVNRLLKVNGHGRRRFLGMKHETVKPDVVVAKDGSGDCKTVSEAIGMASGLKRFVIYVKKGTYEERINTNKSLITLVGEGMYSTIITSNGSFVYGSNASLADSATLVITGYAFMAQDISIVNSAGPKAAQAVALSVASDHSVFHRCSIEGYQDTLYAFSNRQFYHDCEIHGTIDFIFGNAAAVFQNCTINLRLPIRGAFNVILANGRTDMEQNTGFVLQNCMIIASSELAHDSTKSYLGRPWREYSRTVVMQSRIAVAISSEGWIMWPGAEYNKTLYFAEYNNTGLGSGVLNRVKWSGCHVLGTTDQAMQFTVGNFIGGESWLNSTGVDFISGLQ